METETLGPGACIASEANGTWSRRVGVMASGHTGIANQVLGQILLSTASALASASNTGNGTIGAITVGADAQSGDYVLTFVEPASDAGTFTVEDPAGRNVGSGVVGTEFTGGGLTFTVADGVADFAAGDRFVITVETGSEKYVPLDLDAEDGSQIATAVLYDDTDATDEDAECVVLHRVAEVVTDRLVFPDDITDQQKATALAQLEAAGITAL